MCVKPLTRSEADEEGKVSVLEKSENVKEDETQKMLKAKMAHLQLQNAMNYFNRLQLYCIRLGFLY